MSDLDARRHEIEVRIDTALRNAQYALTVKNERHIYSAMTETYTALTALSAYLGLPNGSPKAAATANRTARLWKAIINHLHGNNSSTTISRTQSEIDTSDDIWSSEPQLQSITSDEKEQQDSREVTQRLESLRKERDKALEQLSSAQEEINTLKNEIEKRNHEFIPNEETLKKLQNDNLALKQELDDEFKKIAELTKHLEDSKKDLDQEEKTKQSLQLSLEQLQRELQEKETALIQLRSTQTTKADDKTTSVDMEEHEALKLQVKVLRQALREMNNSSNAAQIKAGKRTLADIEQEHQEQLIALKMTLEQQFNQESKNIQQINDLKRTIDMLQATIQTEKERAERAEQAAMDSVGTAEERHREQLSTLEVALAQQQEQHTREVEQLQTELQSAKERAARAEHAMTDSVSTAEERHREQLSTLEVALAQQQEQHTREVEQLQTELQSAKERAARAEHAMTDSVSTAEERLREQLSTLEETLLRQEKQHKVELASLRTKLKAEIDRAAKLEESYEELSKRHREDMNSLRGDHAKERDRLVKRLTTSQKALDSAKREAESIKLQLLSRETFLRDSLSEPDRRARGSDGKINSEVESSEVRKSLSDEVFLLRARCRLMEDAAASATERSQENAAMVAQLAQQLGEAKARLSMYDGSSNAGAGTGIVDTLGLHMALDTLRGVVLTDLKSTMQRTVAVDEETQSVLGIARSLVPALKRAASLSVKATDRHMELGCVLNLTAAQQTVALQKIHHCLSDSVSLQNCDAATLEACLMLFTDVTTELEHTVGVEGVSTTADAVTDIVTNTVTDANTATPVRQYVSRTQAQAQTQTPEDRDIFVQRTLRRAQQRINDGTTPLRSSSCGVGATSTPISRLQRTPQSLHSSNIVMSSSSPFGRQTINLASDVQSPYPYTISPDRRSKGNRGYGSNDAFEYAKSTLSAEEKQYTQQRQREQQQRPMAMKRWLSSGKTC